MNTSTHLRSELTELEQCLHLARRKEIYEQLHPETKPVQERGGPGRGNKTTDIVSVVSFAEDTAAKTGETDRTVRRKTRIGENTQFLWYPSKKTVWLTCVNHCQY